MRHHPFPPVRRVLLLLFLSLAIASGAQETPADTTDKVSPWAFTYAQGIDLGQLLVINPRPGSGSNFINLGGNTTLQSKYDAASLFWNNTVSWQIGIQRVGAGTLPFGGSLPFSKSMDLLGYNTVIGRKMAPGTRYYFSGYFTFLSQAIPTYPGNFLKDVTEDGSGYPISRFLSPARLEVAPSVSFKSNDKKFTALYTPIAYKAIIVHDDRIAALGIHGNPVVRVDGQVVSYERTDNQLGSLLNLTFTDTYREKQFKLTSSLTLYANYLNHPERVDVEWNAEFAARLVRNLSVSVKTNLFYDYDILVFKTDAGKPFNEWETGRGVSFSEQVSAKYSLNF